jgi:hypothetical protein
MAALRGAGLRAAGVAPGPANGFTLGVIDCPGRLALLIDWAMVIRRPAQPWPGTRPTPRRAADRRHPARGVHCGALLGRRAPTAAFAEHDHRAFGPDGWWSGATPGAQRPITSPTG